jgi:hypothetical protein
VIRLQNTNTTQNNNIITLGETRGNRTLAFVLPIIPDRDLFVEVRKNSPRELIEISRTETHTIDGQKIVIEKKLSIWEKTWQFSIGLIEGVGIAIWETGRFIVVDTGGYVLACTSGVVFDLGDQTCSDGTQAIKLTANTISDAALRSAIDTSMYTK